MDIVGAGPGEKREDVIFVFLSHLMVTYPTLPPIGTCRPEDGFPEPPWVKARHDIKKCLEVLESIRYRVDHLETESYLSPSNNGRDGRDGRDSVSSGDGTDDGEYHINHYIIFYTNHYIIYHTNHYIIYHTNHYIIYHRRVSRTRRRRRRRRHHPRCVQGEGA